ncbi:asparagine synthase (glutamine-hydrolyzing) [Thermodesulfobacteriota bacterium]
MCGICGFAGTGDIEDLERMNAALIHRGPDDDGLWYDKSKGLFLGHRRLSIIDIEDGSQPMWSGDGSICIIYNGEIYNHPVLRTQLEEAGHKFLTDHSDTEVLIYGYREWGEELPLRLNGMWAFAIYDRDRGRIFFSRDRFGKKPLFYTLQGGTFAFSSELSSLIRHRNICANFYERGLQKYYAYGYVPAPLSIYEGIYKLPAGNNLILDVSSLNHSINKYWDFIIEPFESVPKNPEEEWGEVIRDLLSKAVNKRLVADVPLGVFLSGGIDSSSVAACASGIAGKDTIKTFSIGFEEESFNEASYSKRVSSSLGTKHHLKILSLENAKSLLPQVIERLDEPMGDSSLLPTYLLCRETRSNVTVAVGGDGADELFAGYDPFRALKMADLYSRFIPRPVHKGIRMLISLLPVSHKYMSLDFRLKRTLRGLSYPKKFWNPVWLGPLSPHELDELFQRNIDMEELFSEAIEQWDACRQENMVDKTLQFYTKLYLQDDILVKVDRASMMNSLEVRSPYLDIDLVDFVRRIPSHYKYRNGITKYILKKALDPILPREILYRSKQGFGIPLGKWFMDGHLCLDVDVCNSRLNHSFIKRIIEEHRMGKHDHRAFLWNQWAINSFRRTF